MSSLGVEPALEDDLVLLRRELHRDPELGLELPRTQRRVLASLEGLPLEISTGRSLSSVTAVLRGAAGGEQAVLLRADMDALPMTSGPALTSLPPPTGCTACGHDLHTAMLVGAARLLASRREVLNGDVVLMFQPGEEGYDGARHMIEEGVLNAAGQRPQAAYALHVSTSFRRGTFATRSGPILGAVDVLRVTVRGRSGAASSPYRARDPIPAACEMVMALQSLVTRRFDVFDPVVVTVGLFQAGTWPHVIPDSAHFEASVRSFSPEAHTQVREESVQVCQQVAAAHGLSADVEASGLYPVTVNDYQEAEFASSVIRDTFGEDRYRLLPHPLPPPRISHECSTSSQGPTSSWVLARRLSTRPLPPATTPAAPFSMSP